MDRITQSVCHDLHDRAAMGLAKYGVTVSDSPQLSKNLGTRHRAALGLNKYGVTVADSPLSRRQWLQHAYEEALDLAVYLRRAMEIEEGQ